MESIGIALLVCTIIESFSALSFYGEMRANNIPYFRVNSKRKVTNTGRRLRGKCFIVFILGSMAYFSLGADEGFVPVAFSLAKVSWGGIYLIMLYQLVMISDSYKEGARFSVYVVGWVFVGWFLEWCEIQDGISGPFLPGLKAFPLILALLGVGASLILSWVVIWKERSSIKV